MTNLIRSGSFRRVQRVAAIALLLAATAACAVGPDFERPAAPATKGYGAKPMPGETAAAPVAGGEGQRFVEDLDIPGQWWELFHSEPLNALIAEALKANPDLQSAQAALRVAEESVRAQEGFYYPNVSANVSANRQKDATGSLASLQVTGLTYFNLFTAQVSVSYVPDVFGLNRRTVESLEAQREAQRFQLEATYLTLTSNLVNAAIGEASLRGQIAATRKIIDIETQQLDLMRKEQKLGQVAELDVAAQEATLAQTQATLPPLEKQLAQQRDLLTALLGRLPSEEPADTFELADLKLPRELPVTLPAKLVEHRPDVRAAEENLHAASAQVGVAIANRLPNITLSGNYGGSATQLSQLFAPGNIFWLVGGSVAQTVFDGGTLLHKERGAEAAFNQAKAQYRSAVVTAFQNVADALRALEHDADALVANLSAERAAARSLDMARGQMRLGAISYLSLLNAEQTYQQAVVNLVVAQANRYADTVALFQALGGGWWNRSDVAASEDSGSFF